MFTRSATRSWRSIFAALVPALSLLLIVGHSLAAPAAARPATTGNTYVVDSTADTVDADVGADPACADASGHCTLRAAIMQANFTTGPDTITLPSGVYTLTRSGLDDADQLGDLDILDDLTIQGAGSGVTIVDGNGAVTGDRVFQILATAKNVTLSGLTIRNGKKAATFDEGGGLVWEGGGGHLNLNDVIFENNTAYYGGGLYLSYSTSGDVVDLNQVVVRANTAAAAAGGLGVNFGDFATFDLRRSRVYSNTAYEGGGLYFQGAPSFGLQSAHIETTEIDSNSASLSGGMENHSGNAAVPIVLLNSRVHNNHADYSGGAIGNYGALVISDTLLDTNSASITGTNSANTRGGALYDYEGGQIDLEQSTLSGNSAASGGGIYSELFIHNSAALTLTNSTLSGNVASREGGGIYAQGGRIKILNSTLADNQVVVPINIPDGGVGGGVLITGTAIGVVQNALLADNTDIFHGGVPVADDCYDLAATNHLTALTANLIKATSYCTIDGNTSGVISGQSPQLGPLQNNGGSTPTRALLPGSPAIDAGSNTGCPPTDQRGVTRPQNASCDIGAVEYVGDLAGLVASSSSPTRLGSATIFTASAVSDAVVTYTWNFADGSALINGITTTHTYHAVGAYRVIVTATNNTQVLTAALPVTITDAPISGLSAGNNSPTTIGHPTTLMATINSGSHVAYLWNFGDGSPLTAGQVVTHTYPFTGAFSFSATATVTATNSLGVQTATTTVSVIPQRIYVPLVRR